jgi:hypothetical protein
LTRYSVNRLCTASKHFSDGYWWDYITAFNDSTHPHHILLRHPQKRRSVVKMTLSYDTYRHDDLPSAVKSLAPQVTRLTTVSDFQSVSLLSSFQFHNMTSLRLLMNRHWSSVSWEAVAPRGFPNLIDLSIHEAPSCFPNIIDFFSKCTGKLNFIALSSPHEPQALKQIRELVATNAKTLLCVESKEFFDSAKIRLIYSPGERSAAEMEQMLMTDVGIGLSTIRYPDGSSIWLANHLHTEKLDEESWNLFERCWPLEKWPRCQSLSDLVARPRTMIPMLAKILPEIIEENPKRLQQCLIAIPWDTDPNLWKLTLGPLIEQFIQRDPKRLSTLDSQTLWQLITNPLQIRISPSLILQHAWSLLNNIVPCTFLIEALQDSTPQQIFNIPSNMFGTFLIYIWYVRPTTEQERDGYEKILKRTVEAYERFSSASALFSFQYSLDQPSTLQNLINVAGQYDWFMIELSRLCLRNLGLWKKWISIVLINMKDRFATPKDFIQLLHANSLELSSEVESIVANWTPPTPRPFVMF